MGRRRLCSGHTYIIMEKSDCPRCHGMDPECHFIGLEQKPTNNERDSIVKILEAVYRWGVQNTDVRIQRPIENQMSIADATVKMEKLIDQAKEDLLREMKVKCDEWESQSALDLVTFFAKSLNINLSYT